MNRVVLFGAGASHGSPGVLPVSPPLGANLFPILRNSFPDSWGAISDDLQSKFEEHFETGMNALWQLYPNAISDLLPGAPSPNLLMQDMARFFLSFSLGPRQQDSYSQFIYQLHQHNKLEHTTLATLNYEHLLEGALCRLGAIPAVIRPHGGCQIWPKTGGRLRSDGLRAVGQGFNSISARVRHRTRRDSMSQLDIPRQAGYPCMAIYVGNKTTQMAQRYLRRMQVRFRHVVERCDRIALVGVRPWLTDAHIWDCIIQNCGSVAYVGGRSDYQSLQGARSASTDFLGERFHDSIEALAATL